MPNEKNPNNKLPAGGTSDPFGEPFDSASDPQPAKGGGGLLDVLRDAGEQVVNEELAGLQAAMQRVEAFTDTVADAGPADSDLDALKTEWQQISSDLKRALNSGMNAVQEGQARRAQIVVADEIRSLESEVTRKNELIAQLSDTVKNLNRELDEKDRRLRDELRALREQTAEQSDEIDVLKARLASLDEKHGRLKTEHESAAAERDELWRSSARASEALESERTLGEERYQALQGELNEARHAASRLEGEKRDSDRRLADSEKRLQASEKTRAKAETERDTQALEAAKAGKEARTQGDRVKVLETELSTLTERSQRDQKRLRRVEGRGRADAEVARARIQEALAALANARASLDAVPSAPPQSDDDEASGS